MSNRADDRSRAGTNAEPPKRWDTGSIVEGLRTMIGRARQGPESTLTAGEVALLEAAVRALEEAPKALREGMNTAFEIGREHARKEDLLARLEREIAEESARLGREAWGTTRPGSPEPDDAHRESHSP